MANVDFGASDARRGLLQRRVVVALAGLALLFRFWFAVALPVTGDEAYFIVWGRLPDWGFYDHPPMIGWWLAGMTLISDSIWWLRLPSTAQPLLLALGVGWALPRLWPGLGEERRYAIVLLILLSPANVWNVLITTDTPLVYFSVLSGLAWLRAAQQRDGDGFWWYLLAGVLLAGAALSKYFVALLGFAYLLDAMHRGGRRAWQGLTLTYACCVPALALMAWWNAGNCWPNYMFNFVNRHGSAGFSWTTPLLYVVTVLYALSPPVVWLAARRPASVYSYRLNSLAVIASVPFVLFALLSGPKQIGLHWLLSFVPFVMIWVGLQVDESALHRLVGFLVGFALLHVVVIVVISRLPLETWKGSERYGGIVLTVERRGIADALAGERADRQKNWVIAMDGYSNAVTLSYNLREYVPVFGPGSSHARHDDIVTDFRTLQGRNILILRKTEPSLDDYRPYFDAVSLDSVVVRGMRFWKVRGEGFNFHAYREGVLTNVRERFYQLPAWLPQRACYFCDRYFAGQTCRR